ncbi:MULTISPECIES: hypothetical protein [Pseudomonas]|uniref:hypothetical protein n=1 Tax=Pseudomonas TaxID=286 RepID=UPI000CD4FA10|nr:MULTISPECIES: hypothetical protein [Pseudomonas]RBH52409.1 hypothetical protein C3F00_031940 [Pseudomonas sp. MWU13-2860]
MTTSESKMELRRLMLEAAETGLNINDIEPMGTRLGIDSRQLVNELALAVANGFNAMTLDFDFCIQVMNGLEGVVAQLAVDGETPEPALSIYLAFDAGEFKRLDEPAEVCPAEKYTRPMIERILLERIDDRG